MSTPRILVVEDDPAVAELVMLYLRNADFAVERVGTAAEARASVALAKPALVVLDLGLPDTDGLVLFRELRERSDVPVLALTARAEDAAKIEALEAGVDDYVTKPFNPRELVARIRAVLRRAGGALGSRTVTAGNVVLDTACHEVSAAGAIVQLRKKEFELLAYLLARPGIAVSRDKLLEDVWGFAFPGETRTVDVHVKQVRDKLASADVKIETVWGVGYKLVAPDTA